MSASAGADTPLDHWGFNPISTNALPCSVTGDPAMATPMSLTKLMSAGDPATLVGAGTATTVGRENDMNALSADGKYLFASSENATPSDGVTRYTLTGPGTGTKEILTTGPVAPATTWSRLDGGYWYAPSGQLLVGEEYSPAAATPNTQARGGGVWQVDPSTGAFVRLDWLGSMAHEGLVYSGGALFFGDENRTGAFYKAVPSNPADLTAGGVLYYMVGTGIDASGWKAVVNADTAVAEANNGGAILFDRPEDVDARGGRIYFTVTEAQGDADIRIGSYGTFTGNAANNQVVNRGGIYSFNDTGLADLSTQSGALPPYVKIAPMIEVQDPEFPSQAAAQAQQGLQYPDNIAFDGRGHLWVHEDIPDDTAVTPTNIHSKQYRNQQDEMYVFELAIGGSTIVNAGTVSGGVKAGDMQSSDGTKPCTNEFTGGVFGADGVSLFFSQQHNANPTFRTALSVVLPPDVPEVGAPILLALSGGAILGGIALFRRRHAPARA
ncbi:MAG TPA: alkaline phosphatase PhoX [Ilumatobacteraceae bacterium]|nr:alkaline phosphatase PhoX [Ilumatobacteraceae bacterium]